MIKQIRKYLKYRRLKKNAIMQLLYNQVTICQALQHGRNIPPQEKNALKCCGLDTLHFIGEIRKVTKK